MSCYGYCLCRNFMPPPETVLQDANSTACFYACSGSFRKSVVVVLIGQFYKLQLNVLFQGINTSLLVKQDDVIHHL